MRARLAEHAASRATGEVTRSVRNRDKEVVGAAVEDACNDMGDLVDFRDAWDLP